MLGKLQSVQPHHVLLYLILRTLIIIMAPNIYDYLGDPYNKYVVATYALYSSWSMFTLYVDKKQNI